ncbi:MAG TPA: hypothetical protein PLO65_02200 [Caulobacter sp.]|nr:hypothetical protein [Caulobacter sp.]
MVIFIKGRRALSVAAIATLLVALAQAIGTFAPQSAGDPALLSVVAAMQGYRSPMGLGMEPSLLDIQTGLSLAMSLFLVAFAVLGLSFAGDRDASPRTLSRIAVISAGTMGTLTVAFAVFRIPPLLVSMAVLAILFLVASLRTLRA